MMKHPDRSPSRRLATLGFLFTTYLLLIHAQPVRAQDPFDYCSALVRARRFTEAETFVKQQLAQAVALGNQDLIGRWSNNLAVVYRNLNRYSEAESLCKKAILIREKSLGV